MKLPQEVLDINKLFKDNGFKLFVVGGAVRDHILGKEPKDYDVATDATPDQIVKMIDGKYETIDGGKSKDLGVTIMIVNHEPFEVATFREDIGEGRRPEGGVSFSTIEKDVLRRDLTINALFYDIENDKIVDLVGGFDDLKHRIINTVGNAEDRFREDPLRKQRAIRFAGTIDGELSLDIVCALTKNNSLDGVSPERIRDEFKKTVEKSIVPNKSLSLLNFYGFFDYIFPKYNFLNTFNGAFKKTNNWRLQLASFFVTDVRIPDISKSWIRTILHEAKYTDDEIRDVLFLHDFVTLSEYNFLELYKTNKQCKFSIVELTQFSMWYNSDIKLVEAFSKYTSKYSGYYIMTEYPELVGPQIGTKIKELETIRFKELL